MQTSGTVTSMVSAHRGVVVAARPTSTPRAQTKQGPGRFNTSVLLQLLLKCWRLLHIRLIRIKALNEALTLEEEESSDAEEEYVEYVGTTDQPYQPY